MLFGLITSYIKYNIMSNWLQLSILHKYYLKNKKREIMIIT